MSDPKKQEGTVMAKFMVGSDRRLSLSFKEMSNKIRVNDFFVVV